MSMSGVSAASANTGCRVESETNRPAATSAARPPAPAKPRQPSARRPERQRFEDHDEFTDAEPYDSIPPRSGSRRVAKRSSGSKTGLIIGLASVAAIAIVGVIGWKLWPLITARTGQGSQVELAAAPGDIAPAPVSSDGTPAVTSSDPSSASANLQGDIAVAPFRDPDAGIDLTDPMLQTAVQFAKTGRAGSSTDAFKLLDLAAFEGRVRSDKGSAEFILSKLTVQDVINNMRSRALDALPPIGSYRHWTVLGKTTWDGEPAVMLRYFCDSGAPSRWLRDDDTLEKLVPLISLEEFHQAVDPLFTEHYGSEPMFEESLPELTDGNGFLPPRAGFLMLIFDGQGKLVDLVNPMGAIRLSRACGSLYLRDYHVMVIGRGKLPDTPSSQIHASIFGEVLRREVGTDTGLMMEHICRFYRDYGSSMASELTPLRDDQKMSRPHRLHRIAESMYAHGQYALDEVNQFRADFPNDAGLDMAVVSLTMMPIEVRLNPVQGEVVRDSAQRLHDVWKDPFLKYVQWVAAKSQKDSTARQTTLREAAASGFQTSELHQELLMQAIRSGDKQKVLDSLQAVARYWAPDGGTPSEQVTRMLNEKWAVAKDRVTRPENTESYTGLNPPPGMVGPFGPRPFGPRNGGMPPESKGQGMDQPPNFGPPPGFGMGQAPGGQNPQMGQPAGPPPMTGVNVTIELKSTGSFDPAKLAKGLLKKLGASNYQASHSNNTGKIVIQFDGDLQRVQSAIDFGTVTQVNEATRTIHVDVTPQN